MSLRIGFLDNVQPRLDPDQKKYFAKDFNIFFSYLRNVDDNPFYISDDGTFPISLEIDNEHLDPSEEQFSASINLILNRSTLFFFKEIFYDQNEPYYESGFENMVFAHLHEPGGEYGLSYVINDRSESTFEYETIYFDLCLTSNTSSEDYVFSCGDGEETIRALTTDVRLIRQDISENVKRSSKVKIFKIASVKAEVYLTEFYSSITSLEVIHDTYGSGCFPGKIDNKTIKEVSPFLTDNEEKIIDKDNDINKAYRFFRSRVNPTSEDVELYGNEAIDKMLRTENKRIRVSGLYRDLTNVSYTLTKAPSGEIVDQRYSQIRCYPRSCSENPDDDPTPRCIDIPSTKESVVLNVEGCSAKSFYNEIVAIKERIKNLWKKGLTFYDQPYVYTFKVANKLPVSIHENPYSVVFDKDIINKKIEITVKDISQEVVFIKKFSINKTLHDNPYSVMFEEAIV